MNIAELMTAVGPENIQFQMLAASMTHISTGKRSRCSTITFETTALNAENAVTDSGPVGMVVWMPRDKFEAVTAQLRPSH